MPSAVAAYLSRLPNGIASYPEALVKGSVVSAFIDSLPKDPQPSSEIPEIAALLADPPHASAWVSEVTFNALCAEGYERYFAFKGGLPAFHAWVRERNGRLFRGAMYKVLFAVTSPERLMVGVGNRWSAFRRGTSVTCISHTSTHAVNRLEQPPNLHHDLSIRALSSAVHAGLEAAGARDVVVTSRESSPTEIFVESRWK